VLCGRPIHCKIKYEVCWLSILGCLWIAVAVTGFLTFGYWQFVKLSYNEYNAILAIGTTNGILLCLYSIALCSAGSRASKRGQEVWKLSVKEISTTSFPQFTAPHNPDTSAARNRHEPSEYPNDRVSIVNDWPQGTLLPTTSQPPIRPLANIDIFTPSLPPAGRKQNATFGQSTSHVHSAPELSPNISNMAETRPVTMTTPEPLSGASTVDQLLSDEEVGLVARSHDLGLSPGAIAAAIQVGRMVGRERGGHSADSVRSSGPPQYSFGEL